MDQIVRRLNMYFSHAIDPFVQRMRIWNQCIRQLVTILKTSNQRSGIGKHAAQRNRCRHSLWMRKYCPNCTSNQTIPINLLSNQMEFILLQNTQPLTRTTTAEKNERSKIASLAFFEILNDFTCFCFAIFRKWAATQRRHNDPPIQWLKWLIKT